MLKRLAMFAGGVILLVAGLSGCEALGNLFGGGTTGVEGKLELAAGVEGNLDNTKVYLFDNSDFSGSAAESVEADKNDDGTEAEFKFEDIGAGKYYLLAWKDVNEDEEISYGDLVGICDGKYGADEPGMIDVTEDEMKDAGTITMYEYEGGGTGSGSIQVNSSPTGATIYLDGTSTGKTTDALITDVSPGSHTIKLTKSGYSDYTETVTVTDGDTATVDATLTPESGELVIEAYAALFLDGYYVNYAYSFNQDVYLLDFIINVPGYEPYRDDDEYGPMTGGRQYLTEVKGIDSDGDGEVDTPIPTQTHTLYFEGATASGDSFSVNVDAPFIPKIEGDLSAEAYATLVENGYFVKYTYSFNMEAMLQCFIFKWPGYTPYFAKEFGWVPADYEYTTAEFGIDSNGDGVPGDERIPLGTHLLYFGGYEYASGDEFGVEVEVTAP
jgi:hypothetical protein